VYGEGALKEGNVAKAGLMGMAKNEVGARTVQMGNFRASSVRSPIFIKRLSCVSPPQ
jgi:hypothetical protein